MSGGYSSFLSATTKPACRGSIPARRQDRSLLKPLPVCSAIALACSWGRLEWRIACAVSRVSTTMDSAASRRNRMRMGQLAVRASWCQTQFPPSASLGEPRRGRQHPFVDDGDVGTTDRKRPRQHLGQRQLARDRGCAAGSEQLEQGPQHGHVLGQSFDRMDEDVGVEIDLPAPASLDQPHASRCSRRYSSISAAEANNSFPAPR